MGADHVESQLPQFCHAEQPGVRLDRQQQAVLAQQGAGEGVIGRDRDRPRRVVGDPRRQAGAGQPGQSGADAAQQLPRGFAGEREAQHL